MPPLEQSIREALHRIAVRWWRLRAMETVGLSLIAGSAAGLLLVPIFAWQGRSSWMLCLGVLALSWLAGTIAAFRRRPTRMQAALEADGQWRLNQLLVTAAGMLNTGKREGIDPAIRQTIFQLALQELSRRNIRDLSLHRFSRRAWAGMGSLPLLLILLAGICSHPIVLRAAAEAQGRSIAFTGAFPETQANASTNDSAEGNISPHTTPSEVDQADSSIADASPGRPTAIFSSSKDASGNARGKTDDAQLAPMRHVTAPSQQTSLAGAVSGGDGAAVSNASGDWRGGRVASARSITAPWERSNWAAQQTRALQSLELTPPPASYRDLIRDYFSR